MMKRRILHVATAVSGAVTVAGCASPSADAVRTSPPGHDAAPSNDAPPEELPPIRLTLPPVLDISEDAGGFQTPVPLDGASVCVLRARPIGKTRWEDFVETNGPCTTSKAGDAVVLGGGDGEPGVPAMSELVVTAEKSGYRGTVLAVTTGRTDEDFFRALYADTQALSLQREKSAWTRANVPVDATLGDLSLMLIGNIVFHGAALEGATVTLTDLRDPGRPVAADQGPFYWDDGRVVSGATKTTAGGDGGAGANPGTSFVNLREGEYLVTATHPSASCRTAGYFGGDLDHGYSSSAEGGVRVPVLPGHSTPSISEVCHCAPPANSGVRDGGPFASLDPRTCAPRAAP